MPQKIGEWDLTKLFQQVHSDVEAQLSAARQVINHPTDKGDASESVWIDLFNTYLPRRYHTIKGHVADSHGNFSEQIDVIIHDRQYTPLVFSFKQLQVVPAESVYAVFESKQSLDKKTVDAAKEKAFSVRRLHRTSLIIPPQGRTESKRIIAGALALDAGWTDPLGPQLRQAVKDPESDRRLDLGCVAGKGMFECQENEVTANTSGHHATRFLFRLITRLQLMGTVPAISMAAYERFLDPTPEAGEDEA